eukprot:jgi/Ulvmu1/12461/UM009_0113.1
MPEDATGSTLRLLSSLSAASAKQNAPLVLGHVSVCAKPCHGRRSCCVLRVAAVANMCGLRCCPLSLRIANGWNHGLQGAPSMRVVPGVAWSRWGGGQCAMHAMH